MISIFVNSIRLAYIALIFFFMVSLSSRKKRPERFVRFLEILGPSFIKLGQTLSVRPDIVGDRMADALSKLRDQMAPFSTKRAVRIIEKEFDQKLNDIFYEFDPRPVAAASIAQVHKAKTAEGHIVAVKILRPRVKRAFSRDISLFYFIASFLVRFKEYKRLRPIEVVETFESMVKKELDLRMEAASAAELRENCKDDPEFYVPKVDWQRTSMQVLTLEWVEGIPVHDKKALKKAGHCLESISHRIVIAFLNQSYRDGFFHADLHPGNLFINEKGELVPVDFGIMGRLDHQTRIFVAEILRGFILQDYDHVAQIHFDAGYVPHDQSFGDFKLACRAIGEPIMGMPAEKISLATLLSLLFKITRDFNMETQPQLLLLQKTMVLVEGLAMHLDPKINMWQLAEPWIKDWANENLGMKARVKDTSAALGSLLLKMPELLKKLESLIEETPVPKTKTH